MGMSCATFKTMRETMGMTTEFVAADIGVNHRTAQRWESANVPPPHAVEWIQGWWAAFDDRIEQAVAALDTEVAGRDGLPETVTLTRYRNDVSARRAGIDWPVAVHAALVGHLWAVLVSEGHDVEVVFAPME